MAEEGLFVQRGGGTRGGGPAGASSAAEKRDQEPPKWEAVGAGSERGGTPSTKAGGGADVACIRKYTVYVPNTLGLTQPALARCARRCKYF